MNVSLIGRRLATGGVATALAAGALVGAGTTAANAAEGSTTYHCQTSVGDYDIPATLTTEDLPSSMKAGQTQGGGAGVQIDFTVPADLAAVLGSLGVSGLSSDDFGLAVGKAAAPVEGLALSGDMTPNTDGSLSGSMAGALGDFEAPAAGAYDVTMPKEFKLIADTAAGEVPAPCTATGAPGGLGATDVAKNDSTTKVKAPAKVKKGKVAKLVAKVSGGFDDATGKVVFKDGTKKLGKAALKDGKAVYKAKGLKVGKHKITASYAGDGFRDASSDKTKLKVVK